MAESVKNTAVHQVFVSAQVAMVELGKHPNATIEHGYVGQRGRLAEYDLVILDFTEFAGESPSGHIDQFSKQVLEALDKGTTFCFLHYDDKTPGEFADYSEHGYRNEDEVVSSIEKQAGFRWFFGRKIRMGYARFPTLDGKVHRAEFAEFLKKWGASYNFFEKFGDGAFDDILYSRDNVVLGFTLYRNRGMVIYLPFQKNSLNPADQQLAVEKLVDALLTYRAKRHRDFPDWAQAPFFGDEIVLQQEKTQLEQALKAKEAELSVFVGAKSLLLANEGELELAVPKFIQDRLKTRTLRDETYNEDFWLLDDSGNKTAICEVKSVTKGFKKGAIYDVFNHREARGCAESFPAILFVNANLQAASWQKKDVQIPAPEQKIAFENNVLVLRIEDLVRLWNGVRKGALKVEDACRIFHESRGWCEVTEASQVNIRIGS